MRTCIWRMNVSGWRWGKGKWHSKVAGTEQAYSWRCSQAIAKWQKRKIGGLHYVSSRYSTCHDHDSCCWHHTHKQGKRSRPKLCHKEHTVLIHHPVYYIFDTFFGVVGITRKLCYILLKVKYFNFIGHCYFIILTIFFIQYLRR